MGGRPARQFRLPLALEVPPFAFVRSGGFWFDAGRWRGTFLSLHFRGFVSWQYNYYNRNGEIEWTQGPRYNPDDYVLKRYDAAGRLSEETKWRSEANADNNGVQAPADLSAAYATAFYFYTATGNLTEFRDTRQNSTAMVYDGIGQMTNRKVYAGGTTGTLKAEESFGYEPGGQITTYVSPLNGTTAKLYTSTGKLKEQDNPDGSKLYWQYDLIGRPVKETLRNQNYWSIQYDDYNRIVTPTLYSGSTNQPVTSGTRNVAEISKLDRRSNLISKTDLERNTFQSTYDALNRVKATVGTSGPTYPAWFSPLRRPPC